MTTSYDKSADSLYVEIRALPSWCKVEIEEDIMVDCAAAGLAVGDDIQHASTKAEFIARIVLEQLPSHAAELGCEVWR